MVEDLYQNKTRAVLDESVLSKYNTTKYKFSPNRKYVLISYNEISASTEKRTKPNWFLLIC